MQICDSQNFNIEISIHHNDKVSISMLSGIEKYVCKNMQTCTYAWILIYVKSSQATKLYIY